MAAIRTMTLEIAVALASVGSSVVAAEPPAADTVAAQVTSLDQGWNEDSRHDFYFLTQGSQLVPYFWFLHLEQPDRDELFRSDAHMAELGYMAEPPEPRRNPDGLPIGFVKDDLPPGVASSFAIKKAFLGPNYKQENYPPDDVWLGLTCAACHTTDITHKGKTFRVDGGAALVDHERFLGELTGALSATHGDSEKFVRFAKGVLGAGFNDEEAKELQIRVDAYTKVLERLVERNKGEHPYGPARLDAFGAILNQVTAAALEIPENRRPSNAPVSFPFLWDAPHLDWVQWNASAANPTERNVGEVLGVYAHAKLTDTPAQGQFTATARIDNLFRLEETLSKLQAPTWPEQDFGTINQEKARLGGQLFAANCVGCHSIRDECGHFAMTKPNAAGKRFIRTTAVDFEDIGTDPLMVRNFIGRKAKPGALAPFLPGELQGLPEVPGAVLLKIAVRGVIKNRLAGIQPPLDADQINVLNGFRDADAVPPLRGKGYKARPLNGVWATSPFLHNGSVPTLAELLKPANKRVKTFRIGSHDFDPTNVGFKNEGSFEFDTTLAGNWNCGHSGPGHTQTADASGNYRDFTDEERSALIEYIKTLR